MFFLMKHFNRPKKYQKHMQKVAVLEWNDPNTGNTTRFHFDNNYKMSKIENITHQNFRKDFPIPEICFNKNITSKYVPFPVGYLAEISKGNPFASIHMEFESQFNNDRLTSIQMNDIFGFKYE